MLFVGDAEFGGSSSLHLPRSRRAEPCGSEETRLKNPAEYKGLKGQFIRVEWAGAQTSLKPFLVG